MDTIEIRTAVVDGLRLDFPSERQMAALASAWDDDANHQISFLRDLDFRRSRRAGEYASMISSSDLILPVSPATVRRAGAGSGEGGIGRRHIAISPRRLEYLSYFGALNDEDEELRPFQPLKTLAVFLSALEQRRGSVFLVGGNLASLQKAELNVRSTFPELRVVGRSPGNYGADEEADLMRALQKSTPDMIVVGSMVKDGELWIAHHMSYTRSGIFFYERPIIEILAGRG